MNIKDLLNPDGEGRRSWLGLRTLGRDQYSTQPPSSPDYARSVTPASKSGGKEDKAAPKYVEGDALLPVRYSPHVPTSGQLRAEMKRYCLYPEPANIERYPRHIPYNSEKKRFTVQTGREAFEIFQYTFRYQDDPLADEDRKDHAGEKEFHVFWDYNIGLVRTTPFFKCFKFGKTIPRKSIDTNEGLDDLCHSITGGALAAQGYWMPYECARALASTFCYKIRWALVPVFGPDFPSICTPPASPLFKKYKIDEAVIAYCAAEITQRGIGSSVARPLSSSSYPHEMRPTSSQSSKKAAKLQPLRPRPIQSFEDVTEEGESEISSPSTSRHAVTPAQAESDESYAPTTPATDPNQTPTPQLDTVVDRRWFTAVNRVGKRSHHQVETAPCTRAPRPPEPKSKRRKKIAGFTADEQRAAQQLLDLRYSRQ